MTHSEFKFDNAWKSRLWWWSKFIVKLHTKRGMNKISIYFTILGVLWQKQLSRTETSTDTVGCNNLSLLMTPASGI